MYTLILASNPFFEAYFHSDWMGKAIFLSLIFLSIVTWTILIHKGISTSRAKKESLSAYQTFQKQKNSPLNISFPHSSGPLHTIYHTLKKQVLDLLNKNRHFASEKEAASLSHADIDFVGAYAQNAIAIQTKELEKNLYILATIVTLAPFLGLLGTVWGILVTFSGPQIQAAGGSHQMVWGLSLALTTTVLGLLDAIPALIGYNYLKQVIKELQGEMEGFSNEMLALVEMQYRQVDIK